MSDTVVLTSQQWRVLGLWMAGKSGAEIAAEVGLCPHTVYRHFRRLMWKLGPGTARGEARRGKPNAWREALHDPDGSDSLADVVDLHPLPAHHGEHESVVIVSICRLCGTGVFRRTRLHQEPRRLV